MSEGWTKGPWEALNWRETYGWNVVHPAGDAELGNWMMMAERIRRAEDAYLIAAAPDLYAALSGLLDVLGEYVGWRNTAAHEPRETIAENKARAALAKARGETP